MRQKRVLKKGEEREVERLRQEERRMHRNALTGQDGERGGKERWFARKNSPTHLLMHTRQVVSLGSVLQWGTG